MERDAPFNRRGVPPFLVTVDVEPDWGVRGCRAVDETLPRLVELLRRRNVRATFFVVANLLESCGNLLRATLAGHEVASHGLTHRVVAGMSPEEAAFELAESRRWLEAAFGRPVAGFRAPFLKTPQDWFPLLKAAGYVYDSSRGAVAPSPQNLRPRAWRISWTDGIAEIPVTTLRTGWIPFSLTYLRLLAPLGERLVSPRAPMIYFHLHELADRRLAKELPLRHRLLLPRNCGEPAWKMLDGVLARFAPRAMTCSEFLAARRMNGSDRR